MYTLQKSISMHELLTDTEKVDFKTRLLNECIKMIEERITASSVAIANAQAAANAEEKSSAGDKYETSRAMSHLEKDMHARQLEANRRELSALMQIDCKHLYDMVSPGAYIACEGCSFFIAAGLGKASFENIDIYLLSPNAPLARSLSGKRKGEGFTFNKMEMRIQALF